MAPATIASCQRLGQSSERLSNILLALQCYLRRFSMGFATLMNTFLIDKETSMFIEPPFVQFVPFQARAKGALGIVEASLCFGPRGHVPTTLL